MAEADLEDLPRSCHLVSVFLYVRCDSMSAKEVTVLVAEGLRRVDFGDSLIAKLRKVRDRGLFFREGVLEGGVWHGFRSFGACL